MKMHLVRCMIFYCKNNIINEIADIKLKILTKMGEKVQNVQHICDLPPLYEVERGMEL